MGRNADDQYMGGSVANQKKAKTNFNKPKAATKKKKAAPKPRKKPAKPASSSVPKPRKKPAAPKKSPSKKPQYRDGDGSLGQGRSSPASQKRKRQAGYGKRKGPLEVTVRRSDAKNYRKTTRGTRRVNR
jgi:hypothetical protein